jgi:prolyl-tRNA synthetase
VPVRIEIGPKDIEAGNVVVARRDTSEKQNVAFANVASAIPALLEDIQASLFAHAKAYRDAKIVSVDTYDAFKAAIEGGNFVRAHWNGDAETEAKIKEETNATIRCIPFDAQEENGTCVYSGEPSRKRVIFARSY